MSIPENREEEYLVQLNNIQNKIVDGMKASLLILETAEIALTLLKRQPEDFDIPPEHWIGG